MPKLIQQNILQNFANISLIKQPLLRDQFVLNQPNSKQLCPKENNIDLQKVKLAARCQLASVLILL